MKKPQPVAVENVVDCCGSVAAPPQDLSQCLKVRDPIHADGTLLGSETAVQITADCHVAVVTGELTYVVHVIGDRLQLHDRARRLPPNPAREEHPGVERRSDHGVTLDQHSNLLVAELSTIGNKGPAIVVAGEDRAAKHFKSLVEAGVGQVGRVQDYSQLLKFLEQLNS